MQIAQHTFFQVRGKLVPVLLDAIINAAHEGAQLRLPLFRGQMLREGGLGTLDAACSILEW